MQNQRDMNYPNRIIRTGEANREVVLAIQERLNEKGIPVMGTGEFDAETEIAVRAFQSVSRDRHGNPLVIDGVVGPITWSVLFGETIAVSRTTEDPLLKAVIRLAVNELGVAEDPPHSNRGDRVEEYLASVGLEPGNPWCAAFVYWCFGEAAHQVNQANPLVRTGHCMTHWNETTGKKIRARDAQNDPALIRPGHIFVINHGGGRGHTGIVTETTGGFIYTVEGNSNPAGSREGLGVFCLSRKINTISAGFIDYGGTQGG
jgi:hypothetical protein